MTAFRAILMRDLRLALRQGMDSAMVVMFFVIAVVLFPLGVGPEPNTLARIAPGVLWVSALLSVLLSLDRMFGNDFEDGSLELLALGPAALEIVVLAKVLAHWLVTGLPLIIAAPVLAVLLNMPADGFGLLLMALLLGTPTLSLIGAVGAALILGSRRGGVLLALIEGLGILITKMMAPPMASKDDLKHGGADPTLPPTQPGLAPPVAFPTGAAY